MKYIKQIMLIAFVFATVVSLTGCSKKLNYNFSIDSPYLREEIKNDEVMMKYMPIFLNIADTAQKMYNQEVESNYSIPYDECEAYSEWDGLTTAYEKVAYKLAYEESKYNEKAVSYRRPLTFFALMYDTPNARKKEMKQLKQCLDSLYKIYMVL